MEKQTMRNEPDEKAAPDTILERESGLHRGLTSRHIALIG